MERTQFTFYDSFYRAISRIRGKASRCDAYDALCRYALMGEEPDLESMTNAVVIAFEMMRPNLESGRRKAESGSRGGSRKAQRNSPEADCKQTEASCKQTEANCKQTESKDKNKDKNKIKNKDKDNSLIPAGFARFWEAYPRKEGKQKAEEAFRQVTVPLEVLLRAIDQQRRSDQWTKEGGRFIPHPATWLSGRRWEDQLAPSSAIPTGASGQLGEAELEAIAQMMANKRAREQGAG